MTKVETIEIETQVADHVRELARQRGSSLSEAIDVAVRATLERDRAQKTFADKARRRAAALETLNAYWSLPHTGETLTDADLYDENGLPR
ncbi:type II toxin-antitoxin system VapB family antitoxin [Caulobacter hibisci]|uniref:Type II toxin-antitoxin system VapB family antitoxin n=1 Tax=Caulobacter hibisci TaxID=2035993 RepID=A0ABS0SZT5_9CAUL|nr:type II toxin-antitoxin system VapB family antitoxin [Caulobacter hibisci]MBI1685059.1 type II toxin-antitoxin system VapB family antitoxin [Caulobacter hibisci]